MEPTMSKSQKNVIESVETVQVEAAPVETTTVPATKTFVIPVDGSKGPEYIQAQGGVSKAIRTLTDLGYSRGEVAKMLNKRYQHVRNVLITPIKKVA